MSRRVSNVTQDCFVATLLISLLIGTTTPADAQDTQGSEAPVTSEAKLGAEAVETQVEAESGSVPNENGAADDDQPATSESILDRAHNAISGWLRSNVAPPLRRWHEPVDVWLGTLSLDVAMACALGLYAIAVVGVWMLKKDFVLRGAPGKLWYHDLRIWATLVVVPYVVIYWMLGV